MWTNVVGVGAVAAAAAPPAAAFVVVDFFHPRSMPQTLNAN